MSESDYIHALIAQGEHQQQDFKFEISDICKIAKTLSAFANTDGGRLLIGVKDNGKIAGVRSEEEQYMIEAAAQVYCKPHVECEMQSYLIEGRTVLIATIEKSDHRPVCAKTEDGKYLAYVRVKDENIQATPVHLNVWKQGDRQNGELLEFTPREQHLLELMKQNDKLSLNQYCRRAHIPYPAAVRLLAKFIRYGIVETVFVDRQFHYKLKE
ncbi:MAG: ATP-binding protein [Bacteroidaceae bacterium]|nr:ATP-binding protein [Bacteroidaceae bacterium]